MYIRKKHNKNLFALFFSFCFLLGFSYLIVTTDNYEIEDNITRWVNASFIELKNNVPDAYLPLDNIIINSQWNKFTYLVQPWDTVSQLALRFGTTQDAIRQVNNIDDDAYIHPGDELIITQMPWLLYDMQNDYQLMDFANKYDIDKQELMSMNHIMEEDYVLRKWDEIFVPIDEEKAINVGLVEDKSEYIVEDKQPQAQSTTSQDYSSAESNIVYSERHWPDVRNWYNGFAYGHCTRYVAMEKFGNVKPSQAPWRGNAREWYYNAQSAGYDVWQTPQKWSIIVIRYGWRHYRAYGHVAIVKDIDWENNKILIDEMNATGRYVITHRWIDMNNDIIGYIYNR